MKLRVNRKDYLINKEDLELTLLQWLREKIDLTGTKAGCNIGRCGSCTVLIDDKPRLACKITLQQLSGAQVTTIEGFTPKDGTLHPLQQAFIDHGAIQCGFCTPGMVLRAHAFLVNKPDSSRKEIRKAISPNLCRCTGYQQIVDAIETSRQHYKKKH